MLGLNVLDSSQRAVYFASVFFGRLDLETATFTPFQNEMSFEK